MMMEDIFAKRCGDPSAFTNMYPPTLPKQKRSRTNNKTTMTMEQAQDLELQMLFMSSSSSSQQTNICLQDEEGEDDENDATVEQEKKEDTVKSKYVRRNPLKKLKSKKAILCLKQKYAFQTLSALFAGNTILTAQFVTNRMYLKDVEDKYHYLSYVIDAIAFDGLKDIYCCDNNHCIVQCLPESYFCAKEEEELLSAKTLHSLMTSTLRPFYFAFWMPNKHDILALYYHAASKTLFCFEIGSTAKQESVYVNPLFRNIKMVLINFKCNHMHAFNLNTVTQKKIWFLMQLFALISNENVKHPMDFTPEIFSGGDTELLTNCFLLFVQSLLYYAKNHEDTVLARGIKYDSRHVSQMKQLIASITSECNVKPVVTLKKQQCNRIGKFKGKHNDRTFCIVINDSIGFHANFTDLQNHNLFALLLQASHRPSESEFNYQDVQKKLPFLLPRDEKDIFISQFEIKTPYLTTRDPLLCFGCISNLLWPNAKDSIAKLVGANGKKWKLEFEIMHVKEQKDTFLLSKFITALELGPLNPQCNLSEWVSIVMPDEEETALCVFYHDSTCSLEYAKQQLDSKEKEAGLTVTEYQRPFRKSGSSSYGTNAKRQWYEIQKLYFVKDPFHNIWTGSRTKGLVVRRFFTGNQMRLRTFEDPQALDQTARDHLYVFLPAPAATPIYDAPVYTFAQLSAAYYLKLGQQQTSLMFVDDIGTTPAVFVRGNEPLVDFHQCANCHVFGHDNHHEWMNSLSTISSKNATVAVTMQTTMEKDTNFLLQFGPDHRMLHAINRGNREKRLEEYVRELLGDALYARFFIGCIENAQIEYLFSFENLHKRIFIEVMRNAERYGMKSLVDLSGGNETYYQVTVSKEQCACCRAPSLCIPMIASILLVMHVFKPWAVVGTNIPKLCGKIVCSETPLTLNIGLRCKHDWTKGVPNLKVNTVVDNYPNPDILIVDKQTLTTAGGRILQLVFV